MGIDEHSWVLAQREASAAAIVLARFCLFFVLGLALLLLLTFSAGGEVDSSSNFKEIGQMPWLRLDEATTLLDHDVEKARVALERGISKSWLVRPSGDPQSANDPNVPLRVRVMPSAGWRIQGRAWLESPVLHWEESEIECSCKPWASSVQNSPPTPSSQIRSKIEVWQEDIFRLWGRTGESLRINLLVDRDMDVG